MKFWTIRIESRAGAPHDHLVSGDDDAVVALGAFVTDLQGAREAEDGLGLLAFRPPLTISIKEAR